MMGWEVRRGKRFYYRKVRLPDGRVRSIYFGNGHAAMVACQQDEQRRAETARKKSLRDFMKSRRARVISAEIQKASASVAQR